MINNLKGTSHERKRFMRCPFLFIYFVLPSPAKYSFVSFTTVPESRNKAIRVGNCHKTVKCLGNAPHQSKVGSCAKDGNQGINNHKWFDHFFQRTGTQCNGHRKVPIRLLWKKAKQHIATAVKMDTQFPYVEVNPRIVSSAPAAFP